MKAPPGYQTAIGATRISWTAPAMPPPYSGDLLLPSRYGDDGAERDDVDPVAAAAYDAAVADISAFERGAVKLIDQYCKSGRADVFSCISEWLDAWASASALTTTVTNSSGKAVRKWTLASVASAYVRLTHSVSSPLSAADAGKRGRIDSWLSSLAALVVSDYSDRDPATYGNHDYWAAWAVLATAVCRDRQDLYLWALERYQSFRLQLTVNGYLPIELARGKKALQYHNFALQPLVMIAAFARSNSTDLLSCGSLDQLVSVVMRNISDPSAISIASGYAQDMTFATASNLAWLDVYATLRAPEPVVARPLYATRLGGPTTTLYA